MPNEGGGSDRELVESNHPNQAFRGAYRKGAQAFLDGKRKVDCPYDPHNYNSQGVTFSRAFANTWTRGFQDQKERTSATERDRDASS